MPSAYLVDLSNGVPLLEVSKPLRHCCVRMTERYAHLGSDHLYNAVANLGCSAYWNSEKISNRELCRSYLTTWSGWEDLNLQPLPPEGSGSPENPIRLRRRRHTRKGPERTGQGETPVQHTRCVVISTADWDYLSALPMMSLTPT